VKRTVLGDCLGDIRKKRTFRTSFFNPCIAVTARYIHCTCKKRQGRRTAKRRVAQRTLGNNLPGSIINPNGVLPTGDALTVGPNDGCGPIERRNNFVKPRWGFCGRWHTPYQGALRDLSLCCSMLTAWLDGVRFYRAILILAFLLPLLTLTVCGCGDGKPDSDAVSQSAAPASQPIVQQPRLPRPGAGVEPYEDEKPPRKPNRRSLADLLEEDNGDIGENSHKETPAGVPQERAEKNPPIKHDDAALAAAGIRKLVGKHFTLYTDLPSSPTVDELPKVVDLAVPQWAAYFHIPDAKTQKFHLTGYLMRSGERFKRNGLLPPSLPQFLHGLQRGQQIWMREQPSDYYRRHLVLHEAIHGFMNSLAGGSGAAWYAEGMAELLATHRWQEGVLTILVVPKTKQDVPYWGRIKIIQDRLAAKEGYSLGGILSFGPGAHLVVDAYAWSWAATLFFEQHPQHADTFHQMQEHASIRSMRFSNMLIDQLGTDWPQVSLQWQLFSRDIEYGQDVARSYTLIEPGVALKSGQASVSVEAARSWQSSGIELEAGKTYLIRASGRYQLADEPKIWWCEPGGVTIRYHRGHPLGMLLGVICNDRATDPEEATLSKVIPIGLGIQVTPGQSGTLYLRINESSADWGDNKGSLKVQISLP